MTMIDQRDTRIEHLEAENKQLREALNLAVEQCDNEELHARLESKTEELQLVDKECLELRLENKRLRKDYLKLKGHARQLSADLDVIREDRDNLQAVVDARVAECMEAINQRNEAWERIEDSLSYLKSAQDAYRDPKDYALPTGIRILQEALKND